MASRVFAALALCAALSAVAHPQYTDISGGKKPGPSYEEPSLPQPAAAPPVPALKADDPLDSSNLHGLLHEGGNLSEQGLAGFISGLAVDPVTPPAFLPRLNQAMKIAQEAARAMPPPAVDPARASPAPAPGGAAPSEANRGALRALSSDLLDMARSGEVPAPAAAPTLNRLAEANLRMENYNDTARLADFVIAGNPDDRDALNNKALASYGLNDYRTAIAAATRVAKLHPEDETAHTVRALANYRSGEYLQAIEDSKRALALNPKNQTAFQTLKLSENRVVTSQIALRGPQKTEADRVKREYEAMIAEEGRGQAAARGPAPKSAAAALVSGAAEKLQAKDYSGAVADLDKAIASEPRDPQPYILRSAAHSLRGDHNRALLDAAAAAKIEPRRAAAHDALAAAHFGLGRYREAVQDASRSIELAPDNPHSYANRARAYERLGDSRAMLADYQIAASLSPVFAPVYRDAATAYRMASLPPQARRRAPVEAAKAGASAASPLGRVSWAFALVGSSLLGFGFWQFLAGSKDKRPRTMSFSMPTPSPSPRDALPSGFAIRRTIGQGGMGIVYEAEDMALGRIVAVKKMRDEIKLDRRERQRFLQEARLVAALRHPNIVEIFSILEDAGELCLVFEFVQGRTLAEILEKGPVPAATALAVARGVCRALEYAHGRGVIHRDLKPSNIMISEDGQAKVMDFGIARQAKDALSRTAVTNTVVGTPQYMAPEQELGQVRKESDVYALGACVYEMLTGSRPFDGPAPTPAKLARAYIKPSRAKPGLSPALDALIDEALQPDPDKRLRSPAEFLSRLEAAVESPVTR